jgi:aspartate carbamoyltransferase
MTNKGIFKGRALSVVNDLSLDEQLYLFEKTKNLKEKIANNEDISQFQINNKNLGIYLVFFEDSTRTKESFRNAALFHNTKMSIFATSTSSFNKKESYADTFRTLGGYSDYSIFIIRSKLEGVCKWLSSSLNDFALRNNFEKPAFINAGDGKHEHPTQELLDEFSFYEQKNWNREHIHIALIGDLFHGRTTHSKADGLKVFKNVEVDLIAPNELKMPNQYVNKMKNNGYNIRLFESLEEYLSQKKLAESWYFTRLQLERMGEDVREKSNSLINSVTFKKSYLDKIDSGIKFYHPLPRHKGNPVVPVFLDKTGLNGWEKQSINGYYTRIIQIAMLGGKLGDDFDGELKQEPKENENFIHEQKITVNTDKAKAPVHKAGLIPLKDGVVLDHIGKGDEIDEIWDHINEIRKIINLNVIGSQGVFFSKKSNLNKGVIAIPNLEELDSRKMKKLAAIAPGCTLNVIKNHCVLKKFRIKLPPKIYNYTDICCKNEACISRPEHNENAVSSFSHLGENKFTCHYCEKEHEYKEIWNLKLKKGSIK